MFRSTSFADHQKQKTGDSQIWKKEPLTPSANPAKPETSETKTP
jgi:hypothetical protein